MQVQMPRKTHKQQRKNGNKADRVPNIYWRSVTADQLRQEPRYVALPPVSLLASTQGALNYRYVRQDSLLWRELHEGMLTTGLLKQALGMHEAQAAQLVGIHPGLRGSSHLLSAYFHLLGTSSRPDWPEDASSSSSSSSSSRSGTDRNEEERRLLNQRLAAEGPAAGRPAGAPAADPSTAELQASCVRIGLAGDIPVKLAWGKAQEGAALHCLLQLFPEAALEEVGLFVVNPSHLPPSWGIEPSGKTLPRCGASPDGLIVHRLNLQQEALQAAARLAVADEQHAVQWLLRQAFDQLVCTGSRPPRGVPLADSSSSSSEQEGEGDIVGEGGGEAEQQGQAGVCKGSSSSSSRSSSDALPSEAEDDDCKAAAAAAAAGSVLGSKGPAAAAVAVVQQAAAATNAATGAGASVSSSSSSSSLGQGGPARGGQVADQGDSCCNGQQGGRPAAADEPWGAAAGSLAFEPVAAVLLRLLQGLQAATGSSSSVRDVSQAVPSAAAAAAVGKDAGGANSSSSSSSSQPPHTVFVREVVEVKNHCPFAFRSRRKGKKGREHVAYGFSARGPAQRMHAQWVPQLQLHMLATGCQSALLASRCADSGVRVFRLWRDDAYLQAMLQLLCVLQTQHVLQGVQPSAATFRGLPGYRAFLHRTAALARSAECIAAAGEELTCRVPVAPDGYNLDKFWQ